MKITIDLSVALFRRASEIASTRGLDLSDFVREAIVEKLAGEVAADRTAEVPHRWPVPPPRISRKEIDGVDQAIEEAFEQIESEDCPNYIP